MVRGLPYFAKEMRVEISNRTPFFIAKPRVVHLWRNAPCNGRCIMCHYGFSEEARRGAHSAITDEMVPGLLDQIHDLAGRGTMVSYIGGEPLLCSSLLDWLERAKKLKLDFRFTTNGYNLNSEMARRLVAADLFNIGISIESLDPAINESIRPHAKGTSKTIEAIELLLEEKRRHHSRLSVNIKVTITQLNVESIVDIVRRWGKVDGVFVTPQMFEALDGMPTNIKQMLWVSDIERLEAIMSELKQLRNDGYNINADDKTLDDFVRLYRSDPDHKSAFFTRTIVVEDRSDCFVGTENLYIHDGDVKLCPFFPVLGNLITDDVNLKDLWRGEKAKKMRESMRKCQILCTASCTRQLPLWLKIKIFLRM